ncbi:MAG TPA: ribonuclease HI family protein [Methylomirabilota bacterium]|nr:ribonuclease HI family protein [Methylomirabilota bacterium]
MRELRPNPGARLNKVLRLYTDGAARGNPGPAGLGVVIEDDQKVRLRGLHRYIGIATNNEAEYHALIEGLKAVAPWNPDRLEIFLDSNLVVEQVKGKYKVKKPELQKLHEQAMELLKQFGDWSIAHVERDRNKGADAMANRAIDEHVERVNRTTTHG